MKRSLGIILALFVLVSLCAVTVTASAAAADPEALQITEIKVSSDTAGAVLKVHLSNEGDASIDEFGLAIAFYGENGDQIYGYDSTLEGYNSEICNWYYTPEEAIAAGGGYQTYDEFEAYAGTADVSIAIRYYHKVDGDYILIPESQWQWLTPGSEAESGTLTREFYLSPPDSLYDSIGDFNLGYSYYLLDDYNAAYYGMNQGGEWITEVEADSAAAKAGLQVGDLMFLIDGAKPTENVYAVEYAMAKTVAGEKVDWEYERGGVTYTVQIEP